MVLRCHLSDMHGFCPVDPLREVGCQRAGYLESSEASLKRRQQMISGWRHWDLTLGVALANIVVGRPSLPGHKLPNCLGSAFEEEPSATYTCSPRVVAL